MKKHLVFTILSFLPAFAFNQDLLPEFKTHTNGLIYSEQTMAQLGRIVDSLNLKFQSCELDRTYFAIPQSRGYYLSFEKGGKDIEQDMADGIPVERLIEKYPDVEVHRNLIILKSIGSNDDGRETVFLSAPPYNYGWDFHINTDKKPEDFEDAASGRYFFQESGENSLKAFYITSPFHSPPLPENYGRLVQYVDCMVDTSSFVPYSERFEEPSWINDESPDAVKRFFELINDFTGKPEAPEYPDDDSEENLADYEKAYDKYHQDRIKWDSLKQYRIEQELLPSADFLPALKEAVETGLKEGGYDENLEYYAAKYLSRDAALELMRRRRVVGSCSQDPRPRQHAVSIAMLSAETANWPVFLRAHLDVMNDRFERVTDGSYAWGGRQTYIRELEELNIAVPDLMIGSCLRVENSSAYHYYGSLSRIARALSETSTPDLVEQQILEMIRDPELDDYNRLLMVYLYRIYCEYLPEDAVINKNETLRLALLDLPPYMAEEIRIGE